MQVLSQPSSSSSNLNFSLFAAPSPSPNPSSTKVCFRPHLKTLLLSPQLLPPPCTSSRELGSTVLEHESGNEAPERDTSDGLLVARRPVMEVSDEEEEEEKEEEEEEEEEGEAVEEEKEESSFSSSSSTVIDEKLMELAKKMPIFEPGKAETTKPRENPPLKVNCDLALYRAKVLGRQFRYEESTEILKKCISFWPEDGRLYVALGKMLVKQYKTEEARAVYEKGCQATQGENSYIWQCWAVLEKKVGNIRKARELFDAATVADKKHVAAWHGWAILELKQGNIKKARQLLGKGLKFCGGNEYIYQTLALLEAKADRYEQARYLFNQATKCNPKSCASWLAWAQLEARQENFRTARQLFEKAIQSSPKNRFAWHIWGVFEAKIGNVEKGRKLLKIGHVLNPRDAVILQSLALLEYKYSTAALARVLFKRAAELNPRHQPIWIAWGWMEWKEGNLAKASEYYQRALSIDSTTESAARCLQAWGVMEQRRGNLSTARRLFRSSLNVNSQSYVTWMTWASMEEDQGNPIRAEEIRNLYFQQRTEVVDDPSWVMGFLDIIDPAIDRIKKLLNMDRNTFKGKDTLRYIAEANASRSDGDIASMESGTGFHLDDFVRKKLSISPSKLEDLMVTSNAPSPSGGISPPKIWRLKNRSTTSMSPQSSV